MQQPANDREVKALQEELRVERRGRVQERRMAWSEVGAIESSMKFLETNSSYSWKCQRPKLSRLRRLG